MESASRPRLVNLESVEAEAAPVGDLLERYGLVLYPEDPDELAILADWCENRAREADADGDKERGAKFWRLVHHYDRLRRSGS